MKDQHRLDRVEIPRKLSSHHTTEELKVLSGSLLEEDLIEDVVEVAGIEVEAEALSLTENASYFPTEADPETRIVNMIDLETLVPMQIEEIALTAEITIEVLTEIRDLVTTMYGREILRLAAVVLVAVAHLQEHYHLSVKIASLTMI